MPALLPTLPFILLGAALYTSVGHGGATVYLAIFGIAVGPFVSVVLVMNIVAAAIAWISFRQAGYLRLRLLLPFVAASVPMAYLGGLAPLSGRVLEVIRTNSKAERSIKTLQERWAYARLYRSSAERAAVLPRFLDEYSQRRSPTLGGHTPLCRFFGVNDLSRNHR